MTRPKLCSRVLPIPLSFCFVRPPTSKRLIFAPEIRPTTNFTTLYHVGTAEFIRMMAYSQLADVAAAGGEMAASTNFKQQARAAANEIRDKFPYAQAYDERGWMWQPVESM